MHQFNRNQFKSKAALGLLVTIFVAVACSHKNIKEDAAESDLPAPAPVFATEPDANSEFETAKNEPAPEPIADPIEQQQTKRIAKHKVSKKSHKKIHARRRHRKNRKIVKNHKRSWKKSAMQTSTAAGIVGQLPPPPPAPPAPSQELMPPPPPPTFANDVQSSPVSGSDSAGYQWLYIGTGFILVLAAVGYRYRGKLTTKKSRKLVFNS